MKFKDLISDKNSYIAQGTAAFWGTYAACTAVMAAGKVWIDLTGSSLKVSELLGTFGKATFRREAAVIVLVSYIAYKAINSFLTKKFANETNLRAHTIQLISITGSIACGLLAAAAIDHATFVYIKIPMAILGIAILVVSYRDARRDSEIEEKPLLISDY